MQLEFDSTTGSGSSQVPLHYNRKRTYALGSTLELNYDNQAGGSSQVWALMNIRIYIPGPDGLIGAREFSRPSTSTPNFNEKALVYHYDHLGSITAITDFGATTLANDTDAKPGKFSEDAWGQRRNPFTWSGAPDTTGANKSDDGKFDSLTPRGFTGHEMLDDLGLVHMNGRIYDPLLSRFLSADLVVQAPMSLQSYNRYSYVMNNPLTLVDPSGFIFGTPLSLREYAGAVGAGLGDGALNIGKAVATAPVRAVDTFVQGGNNIGQTIVDVRDAGGLQNYMEPINRDPLTAATLSLQVNLQMGTDAVKGIYGVVTSGDSQTIANASVDLGIGILTAKLAPTASATTTAEVVTQESRALAGTAAADARGVATAPKANLTPEIAQKTGAPPLKDQAAEIAHGLNDGKSRVELRSPSQLKTVDLIGKDHGGVETPHVKVAERNKLAPTPDPKYNTSSAPTVPATQEDIRLVRKYLERK